MAYYALDHPRPAYDYDCAGNTTVYNGYPENNYAVNGRRDEDHTGGGYDDDDIYAS